MSAAASLYRRHRPRTFADVVGQEHVVRTLRNAIERDRVHHAYLFVGSRGTGKTSMAKILAASLNCRANADGPDSGPTVSPCGVCESCTSIASGTSLDVMEMDAASNNSVDDIRDLRERVAFAPVSGGHKVYILDEAHMLTPQAWNAFLKTLEEPPPRTVFVLATTEANKVLPTVVDRCHRFDFGRPTVPQIASVLRRVAETENFSVDERAVALVARAARGSFRDALGTLEQLVAYAGTRIGVEDALAVLGVADSDLLFGTVDAVSGGEAGQALRAAARLAETGRDPVRFLGELEEHLRALMVVQVLGDVPPELQVTDELDARLAEQAARVGGSDVVRLLDLLATAMKAVKDGSDGRVQLELALVKAATPKFDPATSALLARIDRLEARLRTPVPAVTPAAVARAAAAEPPAPAPPVPPAAVPPPASAAPEPAPRVPTQEPPPRADVPSPSAVADSRPAAVPERVAASPPAAPQPEGGARPAVESAPVGGARPAAEPAPAADPRPAPVAPYGQLPEQANAPGSAPVVPDFPPGPGEFDGGVAVAEPVTLDLASLVALWPAVLDVVAEESPSLAAMLGCGRPVAVSPTTLTVGWVEADDFHRLRADQASSREALARAVRAVTGAQLRLGHELRPDEELAAGLETGDGPMTEAEFIARLVAEFDAEELAPDEPTQES